MTDIRGTAYEPHHRRAGARGATSTLTEATDDEHGWISLEPATDWALRVIHLSAIGRDRTPTIAVDPARGR
jgi:hypothetical protein